MSVEEYANQDAADEMVAGARGRREAEAEQRRENQSLKQRIQQAGDRETVELDLRGVLSDFGILKGGEIDMIQDKVSELDDLEEQAEEEDWSDEREEEAAEEFIEELRALLVEKDQSDSLGHEFWKDEFGRAGTARYAMRLADKSATSDMSEEELQGFRSE